MLEQPCIFSPIKKQDSNLGDGPHGHLGGVLGGVERLSNVTGIDDCLVSKRELCLGIPVMGMVQVHEQIFVGEGEGGRHAEQIRAG